MSRGDVFAEVAPGIEVETMDEDERPVLAAPGRLRIRGDAVVEGYLGDPEMTRRHFQNGWFYPGDLAILQTRRRLQILGRTDYVLNIGGAKAQPEDLEALVAARAAVDDVGVCSFANSEGIEEVYVAVSGVRQSHAELLAHIEQSFAGQQLGSFRILILPSIPRNAAGKIMRAALKETIAAAAGLRPS
jgi:fatty-acyl-CoA synthase/long-chain acyl-CoA synthetase